MKQIKGINTQGWENVIIPVSVYSLTRIAEKVREMLLSDGISIEEECEFILRALSGATRGVIDSDAILKDIEELQDNELNTIQP